MAKSNKRDVLKDQAKKIKKIAKEGDKMIDSVKLPTKKKTAKKKK